LRIDAEESQFDDHGTELLRLETPASSEVSRSSRPNVVVAPARRRATNPDAATAMTSAPPLKKSCTYEGTPSSCRPATPAPRRYTPITVPQTLNWPMLIVVAPRNAPAYAGSKYAAPRSGCPLVSWLAVTTAVSAAMTPQMTNAAMMSLPVRRPSMIAAWRPPPVAYMRRPPGRYVSPIQ